MARAGWLGGLAASLTIYLFEPATPVVGSPLTGSIQANLACDSASVTRRGRQVVSSLALVTGQLLSASISFTPHTHERLDRSSSTPLCSGRAMLRCGTPPLACLRHFICE